MNNCRGVFVNKLVRHVYILMNFLFISLKKYLV